MRGKVFVPQVPSRYDISVDDWVPIIDLSPAIMYGELEVLLPPEANRMGPEKIRDILYKKLCNISEWDWLLATGDPVIIGIAAAIAANRLGLLRILRWDKRQKCYDPVELQLDI